MVVGRRRWRHHHHHHCTLECTLEDALQNRNGTQSQYRMHFKIGMALRANAGVAQVLQPDREHGCSARSYTFSAIGSHFHRT